MKHNWEYKKLGEVCILTMGQSPSSESYNSDGNGLPFFQGCSDFGQLYPTVTTYCSAPIKIAQAQDVLMSVRAPIGTLNIANIKCCIGRGLASFRLLEDGYNMFLYYILLYSKAKLQTLGTGSTFKAIGKDSLMNYAIPLPPLPIQQKIVAELDKVCLIIDKKKQQLKELDNLAQAIFYDMFGDPVENEKGWEVKKIGDFCVVGTGATPSRDNKSFYEGNIPWVKTTEVTNCHITCTDECISPVAVEHTNCKLYPINTILMAMYGQGKTRGQVAILDIPATTNQACAAIQILQNANVCYLFYQLQYLYLTIRNMAQGCNQSNLNLKLVRDIRVILPPLALQQSFAAKIEAIEKQKELISRSIKEAQTLFDERMDYWFN